MKKLILVIDCLIVICSSCVKQETLSLQNQMNGKMKELTQMAELGSVEYRVTKIIKASDDATWYKFGDRKIMFFCKATLKAGINLNDFCSDNVKIDESAKSITITLPKPQLLTLNMSPEEIKLAYEKVSVTRFDFSANERHLLLQQGEADIRADVDHLGILEDAEKNATDFFEAILSQMGFVNIIIKFT